ncbi:NAD-dependent epimerase/dehydratase family protein [Euzebya sp.]|uniref:NAD-dependent epimerase/dehydratase family protein n=1 Tax=Euzebya sp. TaxID=1971409 RepID=UPI0035139CD4
MSTTAVLGVTTPIGRAVLRRLSADDGVSRLLAVDATTPSMPPPRVEVRTMDPRDRLLALALDGVDVLVHCAFTDDMSASPDSLYGANVGGTRNVLAAADAAGVGHVVVMSTAMAYGAHHDNPLPLDETCPLRANPGFAYGYQRQLVEEAVADWADAHPSVTVTRLRLAPVLGGGVSGALVQRLTAPRLIVPSGLGAPWQLVDLDDVAAAVARVVDQRIGGVLNVAADGWLSASEVAGYLGRPLVEVGQSTLAEVLRRGTDLGISPAPAEVMPYLLHPWVVDTARLRGHGWQPTASNRDILTTFAADHADDIAVGQLTVSRTDVRRAGLAVGGLAALGGWRLWRRGRRRTARREARRG